MWRTEGSLPTPGSRAWSSWSGTGTQPVVTNMLSVMTWWRWWSILMLSRRSEFSIQTSYRLSMEFIISCDTRQVELTSPRYLERLYPMSSQSRTFNQRLSQHNQNMSLQTSLAVTFRLCNQWDLISYYDFFHIQHIITHTHSQVIGHSHTHHITHLTLSHHGLHHHDIIHDSHSLSMTSSKIQTQPISNSIINWDLISNHPLSLIKILIRSNPH
jgi:hypothetical protein